MPQLEKHPVEPQGRIVPRTVRVDPAIDSGLRFLFERCEFKVLDAFDYVEQLRKMF